MPHQPALLRYPGSKWRLAPTIAGHFGEHVHYVEPYFGSGAVFFTKPPSRHELLNDANGRVVSFWRTLRDHTDELCWALETTPWARDEYDESDMLSDDPVEDARRFVVRAWQSHASDLSKKTGWKARGSSQRAGGMSQRWRKLPAQLRAVADRLADAEIENRDALDVVARFNSPDTLIYADPPYLMGTRTQSLYGVEVDDDHHARLLELLRAHLGPAVVSGYSSAMYDSALADWQRVTVKAPAVEKGARREEVLWVRGRTS